MKTTRRTLFGTLVGLFTSLFVFRKVAKAGWQHLGHLQVFNDQRVAPTVAADIIAEDVYVTRVFISNTNATAVVVTLKSKGSSPDFELVPGVTIPAKAVWHTELKIETAVLAVGGLNLVSDTAGVHVSVLGLFDAR